MTHLDDLYEPGDDREPEPDERDEQPVDLDQIEALYQVYLGDDNRVSLQAAIELGRFTGALLDELRHAREQLARWEALPTVEEWSVTGGVGFPPSTGPMVPGGTAEAAFDYARKHKAQAWRRTLTVGPWEPIDSQPPF